MGVSVVWFRRDLRVHDHPALLEAVERGDAIAPLFVVDEALIGDRGRSPNRLWFMRGSVAALAGELEALGAPLSVVRGWPADAVPAFAAASGATRERSEGPGDGRGRFLDELAWRDFYAHLVWHWPDSLHRSNRPAFEEVARVSDPAIIDAWREGRTGYPVVDAAMRQLRETGWMHNRTRMITASFLTKHLGVDWRIGEAHFMQHLVDGDPASNNGGWQWAASTGTDAQPWFRIFNPTRQGLRHDPDGDWVRRWLPELASMPGPAVHEPPARAYLPRIVDAEAGRGSALAAYCEARDRWRDGVPSKA